MERLTVRPAEETELAKFLHARVVGQERAVNNLVRAHNKMMAGIADPTRPISTLLFMGPTGVGKTRLVEAYCEYLFGENEKPMILNCGEYQSEMTVSALIGSSAGYIGYGDKPRFAKTNIEERRTKDGKKLQVILLDEIEKAMPADMKQRGGNGMSSPLFQLLLSVFDRGRLTLAKGEEVNFTQTIIIMTSNLGAREIVAAEGKPEEQSAIARKAAEEFFSPEQFNRIDQLSVFDSLKLEQIALITDLEIVAVAERAHVEIEYEDEVRDALAKDGYDPRYGARELKRSVDRHITGGLAQFLADGSLKRGNRLKVQFAANGDGIEFFKMEGIAAFEEVKPSIVPPPRPTTAEQQYRSQGYVRTMLDRKFRFGDSTGAHVYHFLKSVEFKASYADDVLKGISKPKSTPLDKVGGWTTESKDPLAMVKFVLNDWVKKEWAVRIGDRYQVKE